MKVVTIDDEKAIHLILRRMLAKVEDVEIVGSFQDTAGAFAYLADHRVDLIFADISMPRETGLEFAERLRKNGNGAKLVFVTSHTEYALAAFDVYAFDYIVKPVVQERLFDTVRRVREGIIRTSTAVEQTESSAPKVSFFCLGGITIQGASGAFAKWKSSKSMELFAYLVLNKGRPISRARLIEDLFGDMPLKNADTYLNTTVYQLRKLLENCGAKALLQSDSSHYALSIEQAQVDFVRFEEGCRRLTLQNAADLQDALELEQLYRGDLFGDRAYAWARDEVERFALLYASFTRQLSVALLEAGEAAAAHRLLAKLVAINELDEEALTLLLKALAQQKLKQAFIRHYAHYALSLEQELGVPPSAEMAALYDRLLADMTP